MKINRLITFLKEEFPDGIQMFDTRNLVGDPMSNIYLEDGIKVDYCYYYEYIEIFGLSEEEFEKVYNEVNGNNDLRMEVIEND